MTKNIAYKRCKCDVCGREKDIDQGAYLPEGWGRLRLDILLDLDLCGVCALAVTKFVNGLVEEYKGEEI